MTFKRTVFSTFILLMFLSRGMKAQQFYYNGLIGEKLKIGMILSIEGEKITGEYGYRHRGNSLFIAGTLKNNHFQLIEYDNPDRYLVPAERITGTFDGTLNADSTIVGTWKNENGSKQFKFLLTKEEFNYQPDSIFAKVEEVSCNCYEGESILIEDERISTVVLNRIVSSLNEWKEECPCREDEYSVGQETFHLEQGTLRNSIKIIYNKNNVLTCETGVNYRGAHDYSVLHVANFNLRTGEAIYSSDIFKSEYLSDVHDLVLKEFEKNIAIASKDSSFTHFDIEEAKEALESEKKNTWGRYDFKLNEKEERLILEVYDLWVGDDGHPFFAYPSFEVSVPFDQLKSWIDSKGPLSFLLK